MTAVTPPTITKTCIAMMNASPVASSLENESRASVAIFRPRTMNSR